jgi:uncharacterized protein YndB with AHSA1/START domain
MSQDVVVTVTVRASPGLAFDVFTRDIGSWWKRHYNDPHRATGIRFEPGAGGRLIEIYDPATGEGADIGHILEWHPGRRLAFTWRHLGGAADQNTLVEVIFSPTPDGTQVTLRHTGWDRLQPAHRAQQGSHLQGWRELLDGYTTHAQKP